MLEWWEAAALSVATAGAGGLIGLVTAYWTHRWTTSANRESEEREAKRRVEEEQRQAKRRDEEEQRKEIREIRRDGLQPVMQFLEECRQYLVHDVVISVFEKSGETDDEEARLEKMRREAQEGQPDQIHLAREYAGAMVSAMSIPGLGGEIDKLWAGVLSGVGSDAQKEIGRTFQSAAELIEQYIVSAEPHESSADTQE